MSGLMLFADASAGTADSTVTSAISTMGDNAAATIASILPELIPICATIVLAALGIRLFKKFVK